VKGLQALGEGEQVWGDSPERGVGLKKFRKNVRWGGKVFIKKGKFLGSGEGVDSVDSGGTNGQGTGPHY